MANEANASVSLTLTKNGATTSASSSGSVTVTGNASIKQTVSIGTSDETLSLGDIGTIGLVYFKNLNATNFILIGSDGTLYPIKLKAGESARLRWNAAAIHAKADTGACLLEYFLIED